MPEVDADALVRSGDPEAVERGLAWFRDNAASNPEDATAWFRYGSALDFSGREEIATGAYDRVFELGIEHLPPELQPQLYVQAGSTLRNLGRLDEARALLAAGVARFPSFRALRAFLALVEVSAGNDRRAVELLFDVILADGDGDGSIARFERSLRYYADELKTAG